jgi:transposase
MEHCTCGSTAPWCARADALFNLPDVHVLDVARDARDRLVVTVETDADVGGCPSCGVLALGHGRRVHVAADAPCFGAVTVIRWRKRVWRCVEPACPVGTFSERALRS